MGGAALGGGRRAGWTAPCGPGSTVQSEDPRRRRPRRSNPIPRKGGRPPPYPPTNPPPPPSASPPTRGEGMGVGGTRQGGGRRAGLGHRPGWATPPQAIAPGPSRSGTRAAGLRASSDRIPAQTRASPPPRGEGMGEGAADRAEGTGQGGGTVQAEDPRRRPPRPVQPDPAQGRQAPPHPLTDPPPRSATPLPPVGRGWGWGAPGRLAGTWQAGRHLAG